jgi:hypothetical protein
MSRNVILKQLRILLTFKRDKYCIVYPVQFYYNPLLASTLEYLARLMRLQI